MQGTQVPSQVQEDPTCHWAAKLVRHNYWACTQSLRAPLLSPWAVRTEPVCRNYRSPCAESVLCNERSHCSERLVHHSNQQPPLTQLEKACMQHRPSAVKNKFLKYVPIHTHSIKNEKDNAEIFIDLKNPRVGKCISQVKTPILQRTGKWWDCVGLRQQEVPCSTSRGNSYFPLPGLSFIKVSTPWPDLLSFSRKAGILDFVNPPNLLVPTTSSKL